MHYWFFYLSFPGSDTKKCWNFYTEKIKRVCDRDLRVFYNRRKMALENDWDWLRGGEVWMVGFFRGWSAIFWTVKFHDEPEKYLKNWTVLFGYQPEISIAVFNGYFIGFYEIWIFKIK